MAVTVKVMKVAAKAQGKAKASNVGKAGKAGKDGKASKAGKAGKAGKADPAGKSVTLSSKTLAKIGKKSMSLSEKMDHLMGQDSCLFLVNSNYDP